jgi:hypothetical protein
VKIYGTEVNNDGKKTENDYLITCRIKTGNYMALSVSFFKPLIKRCMNDFKNPKI